MLTQVDPEQSRAYARSRHPEIAEAGRLLLRWIQKDRAPDDLAGLPIDKLEEVGSHK